MFYKELMKKELKRCDMKRMEPQIKSVVMADLNEHVKIVFND